MAIMFSFVPILFVLFLIFLVVLVLKKKDSQIDWEDDTVFKNLYQYLVLFATLMMTIGGSVGVFMSAADYVAPSAAYYQTFDDYKMMKEDPNGDGKKDVVNEEELRKSYEDMIETEKQNTKDNALNGIIKSFGWIIVPLPIFIVFQRSLRKKDDNPNS